MTRPVGGAPSPTQDKYNDVYTKGSTFGQDLTPEGVRALLGSKVASPFQKARQDFLGSVNGIISGVAAGILGNSVPQGYESINQAVTAKLGPYGSAITDLTDKATELGDEVRGKLEEQTTRITDMATKYDEYDQRILDAASNASTALSAAEQASSEAKVATDGLEDLNNNLEAKVEEQVSNSATITTLSSKLTETSSNATAALDKANSAVAGVDEAQNDVLTLHQSLWGTQTDINDKTGEFVKAQSDLNKLILDFQGEQVRINQMQFDVDTAQNTALKATSDLITEIDTREQQNTELQARVNAESVKTAELLQQQLDLHQSMLEIVDIQSPKAFGYRLSNSPTGTPNPLDNNSTTWKYYSQYKIPQFIESWAKDKDVCVAAIGTWVGKMQINVGWNTGATDSYTVAVDAYSRNFHTTGGSFNMSVREVNIVIFPISLGRMVTLPSSSVADLTNKVRSANDWGDLGLRDLGKLLMPTRDPKIIRVKNYFWSSLDWVARDPVTGVLKEYTNTSTTKPIPPSYLHFDDQDWEEFLRVAPNIYPAGSNEVYGTGTRLFIEFDAVEGFTTNFSKHISKEPVNRLYP